MKVQIALLAVAAALAGCGGDDSAESDTESPLPPTATLPPEVEDLFRRFDAITDQRGFYDEEDAVHRLRPGDRALYVLWVVDGEINNGGFSQYLFNSTAELHDEAVESARLVGARQTVQVLERLPDILGVRTIPESRDERQELLDGLTADQEEDLGRLDERWFAGISKEIEAKLIAYIHAHPEAFSRP